jgi:hypothetical protein
MRCRIVAPVLTAPALPALLLAVLLLGACTSGAGHPAGPAVLAAQALTCRNAIDGLAPASDWTVVLDVVALPASPKTPALGTDGGDPSASPAMFAKTGLLIRAGRAFELSVPAVPGNAIGIGWGGSPSSPSRRFVVPPCTDRYGTGWLSYPGGYWADRPLCLPLTVRAGGREQQVPIGIGTPCPGQQPPA